MTSRDYPARREIQMYRVKRKICRVFQDQVLIDKNSRKVAEVVHSSCSSSIYFFIVGIIIFYITKVH